MKQTFFACVAVLACASVGLAAGVVSESWEVQGKALTHPRTVKVETRDNVPHLVFDLSAIPKGAKVYHASLVCSARRQPVEPIRIKAGGEVLKLEAPWYRSFDATAAVQAWVNDPAKNDGFAIEQFDRFDARTVRLDVRYEGKADKVPPQITGLRAVHRHGQTVLLFDELPEFRPAKDKIIYIQ